MNQKMFKAAAPCALFVSAMLAVIPAQAATTVATYDSLGPNNSFIQACASFGIINGVDGNRALQFTPSQTVRLTDIDMALGRVLIGQGSGPATVQLCLDANNAPGAVIESWKTPSITSTDVQIDSLTSVLGPTVAAGKKYWITIARAPGSILGGGWYMSASTQTGGALVGSQYIGADWVISSLPRPTATRVVGVAEMPGDASEDGRISLDDYILLDRGFAKHLTGWNNGDFNGDNVVDHNDYLILDAAYTLQNGSLSPAVLAERELEFGSNYVSQLAAAVPEPTSGTLVLACSAIILRRRRMSL